MHLNMLTPEIEDLINYWENDWFNPNDLYILDDPLGDYWKQVDDDLEALLQLNYYYPISFEEQVETYSSEVTLKAECDFAFAMRDICEFKRQYAIEQSFEDIIEFYKNFDEIALLANAYFQSDVSSEDWDEPLEEPYCMDLSSDEESNASWSVSSSDDDSSSDSGFEESDSDEEHYESVYKTVGYMLDHELRSARRIYEAIASYYTDPPTFREFVLHHSPHLDGVNFIVAVLEYFEDLNLRFRLRNVQHVYTSQVQSHFSFLKGIVQQQVNADLICLFEDVCTFMYMASTGSESIKVRLPVAAATFIKLRMKGSLLTTIYDMTQECYDYIDSIFDFPSLNVGDISDTTFQTDLSEGGIRSFFDKYDELCHSPLFTKLYKVLFFLLSMVVYKKFDTKFVKDSYFKNEREAIMQGLFKGPDFVLSFIKTVTFICQRGYQCMVTGSLDPIYHSGDKYEKWINEVIDCKRDYKFIHNLEAIGKSKFAFLGNLERLIEQGESMYRHAARVGEVERKFVYTYLSDLKLIRSSELTRRSAMKTRTVPFAMLIYGGSKLAKTQFTDMCFYHFGKMFGLPIDDEYKYTRTFQDEYFTNFHSSQWCIVYDDVAYAKPDVCPNGDNSVMELIHVCNGVAMTPPQAALEDKGKNPVLADLVLATTNVEHLNAFCYFNNELAIRRRLPWVLRISPKPAYTSDGVTLDTSLLPIVEAGEYPDFWIIEVCEVIAACAGHDAQRASLKSCHVFDSIYFFIRWFNIEAENHRNNQERAMACTNTVKHVILCNRCNMPERHCDCFCNVCNQMICICEQQTDFYERSSMLYIRFLLTVTYVWSSVVYWTPFLDNTTFASIITNSLLTHIGSTSASYYANYIGARVEERLQKRKFLINMVAALSCGVITYKIFKSIKSKHTGFTQNDGAPITENERPNPWVKREYEVTSFDYLKVQQSLKSLPREDIERIVSKNCVAMHFQWHTTEEKLMHSRTRAFCVTGHLYVLNKHAIPFNGSCQLDIICSSNNKVSPNTTMLIHRNEFKEIPQTDLVIVEIFALPPKKDLVQWFAKESYKGYFDAYYLGRTQEGELYRNEIRKVSLTEQATNDAIDHPVDVWTGYVDTLTKVGDCGSIMITHTTSGVLLLGFHMLGNPDYFIGAQRLTYEQLLTAVKSFQKQFEPSEVQFHPEITHLKFENELHWKSLCHDTEGSASVFGSMRGYYPVKNSAVIDSPLRKGLREVGIESDARAPDLSDPRVWSLNLDAVFECKNAFDRQILDICAQAYVDDILHELPVEEGKLMQILDNDTVVNGKNGVTYIDAINKNTSMGYPWNRSKRFYLKPLDSCDPNKKDFVKFDDEIYDMMDDMESMYRDGKLCHPIFMASAKDEPVSESKYQRGKNRVFTGGNCPYAMLMRKHYLAFIRVFQRNPYIFEGAPGMICQSLEWEQLREYLTTFGTDGLIDGDFEKYDKVVMAMFVKKAFWIIHQIQNHYGQGDEIIREGLAEDTAYPFVIFHGDLIQFYNMLCSGIPLTVIVNCIVNSLYMRYCYYVIFHGVSNFKQYVKLITYGDDNVQGVHQSIRDKYNHCTIAHILHCSGIKYTMADKTSTITPFRSINEIAFLKRTFRWDEDIGAYVAPLDIKSIHKMLCVNMISKSASIQEVTIASVSSAVRELFFHGRCIFNEYCDILVKLVKDCDLEIYVDSSTFPSYDALVLQFWRNSKHVSINRKCNRPELKGLVVDDNEPKFNTNVLDLQEKENFAPSYLSVLASRLFHQGAPQSLFLEISWLNEKSESRLHGKGVSCEFNKSPNKQNFKLQADISSETQGSIPIPVRMRGGTGQSTYPTRLRGSNVENSSVSQESTMHDRPGSFQPGNGGGYYGHRSIEHSQTVHFLDDSLPNFTEYDLKNDPDSIADLTQGLDLGDFLKRPIQIGTFNWTSADTFGTNIQSFNPWEDWLTNLNIDAKVDGWNFIRGKLRLKFITNASPFLYGAVRVAYTPLQNWRPANYNFATSTIASAIPYSQLPGAWIFPQANQGCEIVLPFFTPYNCLDIRTTNTATERIAPADMGQIDIRVYSQLRSANGVAAPSTVVAVYAWMEDITLSGPTLSAPLQSGYSESPLSKQASAVADAAKLLRQVPFIAPYATATEMGARVAAAGLKSLGYSNPPVIENQCSFRPSAYPPVSSSEISYAIDKLTIDPKNELALDPTLVGLDNVDELNLLHLLKKESYLTRFTWADADIPETNKFLCGVAPWAMNYFTAVSGGQMYGHTPMSYLSPLFENWRGSMVFRIQVIASKFHKGRLRVAFDPAGTTTSNILNNAGPYEERVVSEIIDLEENTDVEIVIPYQQAATWLENLHYKSIGTVKVQTSGFNWGNISNSVLYNGALNIRVLTPLTGPTTPTTIEVLISVRAGDDFEFANPEFAINNISTSALQADMSDQIGEEVNETVIAGNAVNNPVSTKYLTYFGENIKNLRQLMRRYSYVGSLNLGYDAANDRFLTLKKPRFPNGGGALPNSTYLARNLAGLANYSYSWEHMHLIPYISNMFCGVRGSVNWTYNAMSIDGVRPITLKASRTKHTGNDNYTWTTIVEATDDTNLTASQAARNDFVTQSNYVNGAAVTDTAIQPTVNIQLPYYSRLKFQPSHANNFINPAAVSSFHQGTNAVKVECIVPGGTKAKLQSWCSIGTDFNLHFFLCCPMNYTYTTTPGAPV